MDALDEFDSHESVVRVQLTLRAEQEASLQESRIKEALGQASSITIQRDVQSDLRTRLGDEASQSLTPIELVERYFALLEEPEENLPSLLARAEEIIHDSDET